jgi:hypothetical protein
MISCAVERAGRGQGGARKPKSWRGTVTAQELLVLSTLVCVGRQRQHDPAEGALTAGAELVTA